VQIHTIPETVPTSSIIWLGDLSYKGAKYTWSNRRPSSAFVKERLDRALATTGWCQHFPKVSVTVLPTQSSDHKPLWIQMQDINTIRKQPRNFKFEASWNVDEESVEIIQNTWQVRDVQNCSLGEVQDLLTGCKDALSVWSSRKYGDIGKKIKELTLQLERLQRVESPTNLERPSIRFKRTLINLWRWRI
jgi:hypothetical protein